MLRLRDAFSLPLVSASEGALRNWRRTERALRLQEPLPPPAALPWLVGAVVAVAIFLAAFSAYQALTGV